MERRRNNLPLFEPICSRDSFPRSSVGMQSATLLRRFRSHTASEIVVQHWPGGRVLSGLNRGRRSVPDGIPTGDRGNEFWRVIRKAVSFVNGREIGKLVRQHSTLKDLQAPP